MLINLAANSRNQGHQLNLLSGHTIVGKVQQYPSLRPMTESNEKNNLVGSIYRVTKAAISPITLYLSLDSLTTPEKQFISTLIELAVGAEGEIVDISREDLRKALSARGYASGLTPIKDRSARLVEAGIFKKSKHKRPKVKASDLFELQSVSALSGRDLSPAKKYADHRKSISEIKGVKTSLVEADKQILEVTSAFKVARSERLWNGVLGSAQRTSALDPRKGSFVTTYLFGKEQITITTESSRDISVVEDQRTIRALNTLICLKISELAAQGKEIRNEFYIDIVELCSIMGIPSTGSSRDTVRDSMERLYHTNYRIELDPNAEVGKQFAAQFGLTPGTDDNNFRFLTEMDIASEKNGQSEIFDKDEKLVRRPRWYRIALHSKTFADLIDPNVISTFIDNKDILKLQSGLLHLLYTWCSIHVKRSGRKVVSTNLNDLYRQTMPSSRIDNFKKTFITAAKAYQRKCGIEWVADGENVINLFGYIVRMTPSMKNEFDIEVTRDINDPVIGDNSKHNLLLRQAALDF